jgi:transcriptional regulator with XRE-family HTH domain
MGTTALQRVIAERQRLVRRALAEELRRVRLDEGLSQRRVSDAAGFHPSHLPRIETCERQASTDAMVAFAAAMGYDVSIRLFAAVGPRIRDHLQGRMIEALLAARHSRWSARLEVGVYHPVRGVIDVVLQDRESGDLVAGEGHSLLHTVERQLRWAGQKADALPSARGFPWADHPETPRISRLLLLPDTAAMRELVATLPAVFSAAYPAATEAAVEALTTGTGRWPGDAIVWVRLDGAATRLLADSPRGIRLRPGAERG